MNHIILSRVPLRKVDIEDFFRHFNLLSESPLKKSDDEKKGGMVFDTFKKTFFPHMH